MAKALVVVNAAWIAPLGNVLCTFSKPIPVPVSMKDAKPGELLVRLGVATDSQNEELSGCASEVLACFNLYSTRSFDGWRS
jgi:hypothetical protein